MKATANQNPAEMLDELRSLVAEAEKMINEAATDGIDEAATALRERFETLRKRFTEVYSGARDKVVAGAHYTDSAIRENPYQSLAIALGAGMVVGVLLGRRCARD